MSYGTFAPIGQTKTRGADVHTQGQSLIGSLAGRVAFHVADAAGFNPTMLDAVAKSAERVATQKINEAAIHAKAKHYEGTFAEAAPLLR